MDYSNDYFLCVIQLNNDIQTSKKSDMKMYLLLNTYAGGGSAKRKWVQIKSTILKKFNEVKIINLDNSVDMM